MNCLLCQKEPQGELSHIIPSFAFKWLKKTSATGFLRNASSPNRRVQDGEKYPLLCEGCEDLFSGFEREFANRMFHPYTKDKKGGIEYERWFLKFSASIAWRALHHLWHNADASDGPLQEELNDKLDSPYQTWKEYLLGNVESPGNHRLWCCPVDDISNASLKNKPIGMSTYFTGAIDLDLVSNSSSGFVYIKLPYFLFFGEIFNDTKRKFSSNLQVRLKGGKLAEGDMHISEDILNYVLERGKISKDKNAELSDKQKELLEKSVQKDFSRAKNSRSMKSFLADEALK